VSDKNWPLIIQTGLHLVNNPDQWKQASWCGCFAGHAVQLAGCQLVRPSASPSFLSSLFGPIDTVDVPEALRPVVRAHCERYGLGGFYLTRPGAVHVSDAAQAVLGLTPPEGGRLFDGCNTLGTIRAILGQWAAADGVELPPELQSDRPVLMWSAIGLDEAFGPVPDHVPAVTALARTLERVRALEIV
jgi:hypothetical protein